MGGEKVYYKDKVKAVKKAVYCKPTNATIIFG